MAEKHERPHQIANSCKMKNMKVSLNGMLAGGVTAKDMALAVMGLIGTAGGTGCTIEFTGDTVQGLSMEGRMTLCNMAIEAGARAGLVAVDDGTIDYLRGRTYAPAGDVWDQAVADRSEEHTSELQSQ